MWVLCVAGMNFQYVRVWVLVACVCVGVGCMGVDCVWCVWIARCVWMFYVCSTIMPGIMLS